MKHLEPIWVTYRHAVIPKEASQELITECKRAFYAGAKGLFDFIGSNINNTPGGPTPESFNKIVELDEELRQFCLDVEAGLE